jgi:hypothetical protein
MCQGGQLGGILGGLGGTALSILGGPEIGIPLFLASGLGAGAGTTIGDVASGKPFGASLEEGAISGGISGALAGAGNLAAGGDFFGAPASSITGFFSGAPTAAADTASAASGTAAAAPVANLASAAPSTALTTAPTVGVGGGGATLGGDVGGMATTTGGVSGANLSGAVGGGGAPIGPTGNTGPLGVAGPVSSGAPSSLFGGAGDVASYFNQPIPAAGAPDATATGGNFLSRIFGGGTNPAAIADLAQGGAPLAPNISASNLAALSAMNPGDPALAAATATGAGGTGSASFLSRGLAGEPGSFISDLTKPSTLITGGAAAIPLLRGNTIPGLSDIQNQAKTYNAMGTPLAQSLITGNLPPGAASALDAATRAGEASVRSRFAQMGLTGSSQEADMLAGVQANRATQQLKMLEDITNIGTGMMARADPLLQNIMTQRYAQDVAQQQAIARLAAALAGGTGTSTTAA